MRHQPGDYPLAVLGGSPIRPRLCLSVVRPASDAAGIAAAKAMLVRLAPHLARALEISRIAAAAKAQHALDAYTLDRLSVGIVYADAIGRVTYANTAGEDILRRGDGVKRGAGGVLAALDPAVTERLLALIRVAAGLIPETASADNGMIAIPRLDGLAALAVLVAPLPGALAPFGRPASRAALFLRRPEDNPPPRPGLSAILNLTRAESSVVELLAGGETLEGIAGQRQVSLVTVRNQVNSALQKTGARRQSELLRLVWRASADLR